jgi:hypothetical protein
VDSAPHLVVVGVLAAALVAGDCPSYGRFAGYRLRHLRSVFDEHTMVASSRRSVESPVHSQHIRYSVSSFSRSAPWIGSRSQVIMAAEFGQRVWLMATREGTFVA